MKHSVIDEHDYRNGLLSLSDYRRINFDQEVVI